MVPLSRHKNEDKIPSNIGFGTYTFDIEERMIRKTRYFRVVQTKPNEGQHDLGKESSNTIHCFLV